MQINRGLLSWGVFLIVAGLIPLAVRAGWLSASQIAGWWNLWPLVLIGIGVGLVLTRTPFEVLGSVLVAGTFGLMLGAVLAIGIRGRSDGTSIRTIFTHVVRGRSDGLAGTPMP